MKIFSFILCSILCFAAAAAEEQIVTDFVNDPRFDRMTQLLNQGKPNEAQALVKIMVDEGNPLAMFYLGQMLESQNKFAEAASLYRRGSERGELSCKYYLAQLLYAGKGVEKDLAAAFKLAKSVADTVPHTGANMMTASMLIQGDGCQADFVQSVKYLRVAADPENDENGKGLPGAQLLAGVYYKEHQKDFAQAFYYLELAAAQGNPVAWLKLGVMYYKGSGLSEPRYDWAELCFLAAEKIEPDDDNEFNLALIAMNKGDLEQAKHWMKLAADKGSDMAKKFLTDTETHQKIIAHGKALQSQKDAEKKAAVNPLNKVQNSFFDHSRKVFGTTGKEVLAELSGYAPVVSSSNMLRMPHDKNIRMPGWEFDSKTISDELDKLLFVNRDGSTVLMDESFKAAPLQSNLLPINPSLRVINARYEDAMRKALAKAGYKKLDKAAVEKLIKRIESDSYILGENQEHDIWQITDSIYFHIHADYSGRWQLRNYNFILDKGDKPVVVADFGTPPGKEDADMVAGVILLDKASMNNLAVKFAEGEMDNISRRDDEAEDILLFLTEEDYLPAVYNLAVYYSNRGRKEDAEKYLALAEKLAAEKNKPAEKK